MTTAANPASGMFRAIPLASTSTTPIAPAATTPAACVREPAVSATMVRDALVLIGNP